MTMKAPPCSHMSRLMLGTDFDIGISHGRCINSYCVRRLHSWNSALQERKERLI